MSRSWLLLALVAGCAKDDDAVVDTDTDRGDTDVSGDTDMPDFLPCSDDATEVAADEVTPLGFSALDALGTAAADTTATADWSDDEGGGSTTVTLLLAAAGTPRFHVREPIEDTDGHTDLVEGPPLGLPDVDGCPDQLEIPVDVTLGTADGRLDETVRTALFVSDLAAVSVSADLPYPDLGGSFVFQGIDPAEWDTVTMDFGADWIDGFSGQVNVSASRDLGGGTGEGYVGPVLIWPGEGNP